VRQCSGGVCMQQCVVVCTVKSWMAHSADRGYSATVAVAARFAVP
jgi:hypothetical protein